MMMRKQREEANYKWIYIRILDKQQSQSDTDLHTVVLYIQSQSLFIVTIMASDRFTLDLQAGINRESPILDRRR